jgi:molybdopterin-guanine dinucleotide biosynthesis protein A
MVPDCSAAILTGGKGRRMGGATKGLLEIDGVRIIERQLAVLRPLFAEVFLVGDDPSPFAYLGLSVVPDAIAGKGAPGGVHAALAHSAAPWIFCLASDMPFAGAAAIDLITSQRGRVAARAVAPLHGGFPEPLFAVYSKTCLPDFDRALREGNPPLAQLLRTARAHLVPEAELEAVDPGARSLWNLNTPEDLARAAGPSAGDPLRAPSAGRGGPPHR